MAERPAAEHTLDELRDLALRLASAAAEVHRDGLGRTQSVQTKSSSTDMVTEVDREAERVIVEGIAAARPYDGVLGEEGASREGSSGVRWIVDPLDGTTNYLYRYPAFAVSIGVEVGGEPAVGVVRDSLRDVVYAAVRGRGATRDGEAIHANERSDCAAAIVATGFSYDSAQRARQGAVVAHLLPRVRDIRRSGSAALDLCAVASGRVDAFFESGLGPWDLAAGRVIAEESGATVAAFDVGDMDGPLAVAAHPSLLWSLVELLRDAGLRLVAS